MKELSPKGLGLSLGLLWGVGLALWTAVAMYTPWGVEMLDLVGTVYPWYTVSWGGVALGFIWGFLDGFIGGALVAWLYNKFV